MTTQSGDVYEELTVVRTERNRFRKELESVKAELEKAAMLLRPHLPYEATAYEFAALRVAKALDEAAAE